MSTNSGRTSGQARQVDRVRPTSQSGPGAASALLRTSVLLIVILCWGAFVEPAPSMAGYLGLAIVLTALLALVADIRTGCLGPLSLTFWAFIAVWAGIAPLYQIRVGRLPWADTPLTELYPWAQLLTLVAILAYRVGQVTLAPSVAAKSSPPVRPRLLAGGVLLPLAAFPLAAISGVSLASRFESRDDLNMAYAAEGFAYGNSDGAILGILKILPICLAAVGLYVVLAEIMRRRRSGEKVGPPLVLALAIAAASAATFANPISNSRFQGFSAILMAIFVLASFRTMKSRTLLVAGLVVGLLIAYPLSAAFKNEAVANRVYFRLDIYATVDFDGFQQAVNALSYVQQAGHTFGHHLVSAAGFFIPRSIWEGKAVPASFPVAESRGYTFQNLSLPLWAEMYVEFGVLGMLIVLFVIGRLSRRADLEFRSGAPTRLAMITPVLAAVQIGVLRGPLGAQVVLAATCAFLAFISFTRDRAEHSQEQGLVGLTPELSMASMSAGTGSRVRR